MDQEIESRDPKPGESVGLFIVLPSEISEQFPSQAKQKEDETKKYKDIRPQGEFEVNHLWLWGGSEAEIIHIGKKEIN